MQAWAGSVVWYDGHTPVTYVARQSYAPVVEIALKMFANDMKAVTGHKAEEGNNGKIEVIELDRLTNKEFKKIQKRKLPYQNVIAKPDAFYIGVHEGRLVVIGDNARGTAYGVLELSRMAGVSPWIWWGDVVPVRQKRLTTDDRFNILKRPSVVSRGIYIENEMWSLLPWAGGELGSQTYEKLFELLLRLRANTICLFDTNTFLQKKGNCEIAKKFEMNVVSESDEKIRMWCDDNYGYLTSQPDSMECRNGVYYHLSYMGAPHDYLWLSTTQPGLLYHELSTAYEQGARRMWIANVHDPKVAAYQLSLFLDMAWNANAVTAATLEQHLQGWLTQQFGHECGRKLLPVMRKFYELTAIRRPEFMGWSQVELDNKLYPRGLSPAGDTEFHPLAFGNELQRYLNEYQELRREVEEVEKTIRPELSNAFFAAVKYPVYAASSMATKHLEAQEARHLARPSSFHHDDEALGSAARSLKAWRELQQLTHYYNKVMAAGKWDGIMSMNPRKLPVFDAPALPDNLSEDEIKQYGQLEDELAPLNVGGCIAMNAANFDVATEGVIPIPMLGHSMKAVDLSQDQVVTYHFNTTKRGEAILRLAFIPSMACGKTDRRVAVSVDDQEPVVFSLKETFNSEQWKKQVLRGQALRELPLTIAPGRHQLVVKAMDNHIVFDQWMLDINPSRPFYRIPTR